MKERSWEEEEVLCGCSERAISNRLEEGHGVEYAKSKDMWIMKKADIGWTKHCS